jgi:hypothetical protein
MSEMKLIMESWRKYAKDDNSGIILKEVKEHLEIHSVIQEGFFDNLAQKIPGGKKALSLALVGMIAANALTPGVAAAAETYVDDSGVNVEQSVEMSSEFSEDDSRAALGYLHKYQQDKRQTGGREALSTNSDLAEKLTPFFDYFNKLSKGSPAESPDDGMTDFLKNKVSSLKQSDIEKYNEYLAVGEKVNIR